MRTVASSGFLAQGFEAEWKGGREEGGFRGWGKGQKMLEDDRQKHRDGRADRRTDGHKESFLPSNMLEDRQTDRDRQTDTKNHSSL